MQPKSGGKAQDVPIREAEVVRSPHPVYLILANVLKKYKESSSLLSSFTALTPLGDGVHASDFHQSSIK